MIFEECITTFNIRPSWRLYVLVSNHELVIDSCMLELWRLTSLILNNYGQQKFPLKTFCYVVYLQMQRSNCRYLNHITTKTTTTATKTYNESQEKSAYGDDLTLQLACTQNRYRLIIVMITVTELWWHNIYIFN